jgi:hypothetical protein
LPAERVPQLLSAAVLHPREQLVRGEAKGYAREEIEGRRLVFEVSFVRVIHVGDAGPDRVEGFERADKCAGRKNLDLDTSARGIADRLRETDRHGMNTWRCVGPVGHHLQLSDSLRDGGRGKGQGRAGGC